MTEAELRAVIDVLFPEKKQFAKILTQGERTIELPWQGSAYVVKNVAVYVNGLRARADHDCKIDEAGRKVTVLFGRKEDQVLVEADVFHLLELMAAVSGLTSSSP